jgi:hypothetical protein
MEEMREILNTPAEKNSPKRESFDSLTPGKLRPVLG